jgi:hypothetical protein
MKSKILILALALGLSGCEERTVDQDTNRCWKVGHDLYINGKVSPEFYESCLKLGEGQLMSEVRHAH